MLHDITYSIVTHLKEQVIELNDVIWLYDGVRLTGLAKPFGTVEQMQEGSEILASGRTLYEDTYRFQIGLMATSVSERSKLSEKIKKALRQPNITLIDTGQTTGNGLFNCDVVAVTPMPQDSVSDKTNKHRVYFDVEISVLTK